MDACSGLNSLQIIYKASGRLEAVYVSEFFKLCGVIVTERDVDDTNIELDISSEGFWEYDCHLFIGIDYEQELKINDSIKNNKRCISYPILEEFTSYFEEQKIENMFADFLDCVTAVFDDIDLGILALAKIYVYSDYCRLIHKKRSFVNEIAEDKKKQIFLKFFEIAQQFSGDEILKKEYENSPYVRCAKIQCVKRVNDLCEVLGISPYYSPRGLVNECIEMLSLFPNFIGGYMVAATVSSTDQALYDKVIVFYKSIIKRIKRAPYCALLYYRLGQFFEKNLLNTEDAYYFYRKAVEVYPQYYRAVFKVASEHLDNKKYKVAIEEYVNTIHILANKSKNNVLLPIEIEYLCKCYLLIGLIYDYFLNTEKNAVWYYREAIMLVEKDLKNCNYFELFFDGDADLYRNILQERISIRQHILVDKYR